MTGVLPLDRWLGYLNAEYLSDYVPEGGAAVKFVVSEGDGSTATIARRIATAVSKAGFVVAPVDAAGVRVHMVDRLFHAVAAHVPWTDLVDRRLREMATAHFSVPSDLDGDGVAVQIARESGLDANYVRMALEERIANEVFKDHDLALDFRLAMTWLCRARLNGGEQGATQARDIESWLKGEVPTVSAMKPYQIHAKVNRTNARHHFESLFNWVRRSGRTGTAIVIDGGRFTEPKRVQDGSVNYTKASRLDAYEVLRQFIDSTDQLESALVIVVATQDFLDIEPGSRGLGAYQALKNRVYDEVRDREFPNPMSSLVRVSEDEEP